MTGYRGQKDGTRGGPDGDHASDSGAETGGTDSIARFLARAVGTAPVPAPPPSPDDSTVASFLEAVRASSGAGRGRLIFALDATASRQPTWDLAMETQAAMFSTATRIGGLSAQLVFYRGIGQCLAGPWVTRADEMVRRMSGVTCRAGRTQIGRVLRHALNAHAEAPVAAVVFIGDCVEEEPDALYALAGEMGLRKLPVFVFHEGREPFAARVLGHVARLAGGAFCPFDAGSADQLRRLLEAVAIYAAAGRPALEDHARRAGGAVLRLTHQLGRGDGNGLGRGE